MFVILLTVHREALKKQNKNILVEKVHNQGEGVLVPVH